MEFTNEDIEYLGKYFVPRQECSKIVSGENEKIASLKVDIAKLGTKLSILIAILSAVAVPVVSLCVKYLLGS